MNIFFKLIFLALLSNHIHAIPHWDCVPNDDVIEFADCESNQGEVIRVSSPEELGLNFTLSAVFPSGSIFEGKSVNGNAFGKRIDPNGQITEAPLEGYFFNGVGKIYYSKNELDKELYEGEILIDQPNGLGKITYRESSDWDYMEGIFDNGRHVSGTYYQRNGMVVKGVFDEETKTYEGFVEIEYKNDSILKRYEGNVSDGKKNGYGKEFLISGSFYEGNFQNDKWHGFGRVIFEYQEGDVVSKAEGIWVNGNLNGFGTVYDLNGDISYSGEFVDNKSEGFGTTFFEEGQWVGEHKDDWPDGNGVQYFKNGDFYKGYLKEGIWQGPGTLYYTKSNETYIGNFQNGILEGEAEYISDTYRYKGPFKNGLFHGSGLVTLNDGETYFAEYKEGKYVGELDVIPQTKFARVALVIGNDNYISGPLDNAVSDSIGIRISLEASGFEVIYASDADQKAFLNALEQFEKTLQRYGPKTEALFYYAGHAVQVDGTNYLNPIDAEINTKYDLEVRSINVSRIFSIMEKSIAGIKIVILDACRNNPFTSFSRSPVLGLAQMNAPSGMIISYSTSPGSVALDGTAEGYGYFTGSLINAINTPGLTIEQVFKKTRQSVVSLTNRQQIPWESSSLLGDFYFNQDEN